MYLLVLLKQYPVYRNDQAILNTLQNNQNLWFRYIECIYELNGVVQSPGNLLNLFRQGDLSIKLEILEFLKKTTDPIYLDILLTACSSRNDQIVLISLSILERIGSELANDSLLLQLNNDNLDIEAAVIKALGRCGTMSAYPVLKQHHTTRPWIRKLLRSALKQIQARYNLLDPELKGALSLAEKNDTLTGALSITGKADKGR